MPRFVKALVTLLLAGVMLITVAGQVSAASVGILACWNNGCPATDGTN